jgi:hypothetical protein
MLIRRIVLDFLTPLRNCIRFQHDSGAGQSAECMECGTRAYCTGALTPHHASSTSDIASAHAHQDLSSGSSRSSRRGRTSQPPRSFGGPRVDLWLCLICGYTGCGLRYGGHIQRHYEETLHTYAQNTDSRQVSVGGGYWLCASLLSVKAVIMVIMVC